MVYTSMQWLFCFFLYSFLGWGLEVGIVAIKERRFRNRGFCNLPFSMKYGAMMIVLMTMWPDLIGHNVFKFFVAFIVFVVIQAVEEFCSRRVCRKVNLLYEDITPYNGEWKNLVVAAIFAFGLYFCTELFQPILYLTLTKVPSVLLKGINFVLGCMIVLDLLVTTLALYSKKDRQVAEALMEQNRAYENKIQTKICDKIWLRLEKAYPGITHTSSKKENYVFAEGICLDKLIWIFIVSAFLGDLIETLYCRFMGGVWMSRSSVLYGSFSVVWGLGAVVLTLVLSRFAKKDDRYIFLIGSLLGGIYEYGCSLFTELVFGTVFWDYSWMPFNIGGRTNLLYMGFWGILSVVWIKICYPWMSGLVEKLPAVPGKILTYGLILFMICNALLSGLAMKRYVERRENIPADTGMEVFLDETYGDELIEKVWPNMVITK